MENYLEKILSNAKGFYGGAFIRFKVKAEAKEKFEAYLKKLAKIEEGAGRHFDPELVEIFLSCLDIIRSIQKRYQDEATNV